MRPFDGVIFDMDGTLIEPLLDFGAIRAELGIEAGAGILETLDAMGPDRARPLRKRLLDRELAAARRARPNPGAAELLARIRGAGLKTALLTRNAAEAMRIVLEKLAMRFDLAWSREDGPIKPEPDGVLRACRELGVEPARCLCVGDFRYDLVAANDAGAVSVLLTHGDPPDFAALARHVVRELAEVAAILEI